MLVFAFSKPRLDSIVPKVPLPPKVPSSPQAYPEKLQYDSPA